LVPLSQPNLNNQAPPLGVASPRRHQQELPRSSELRGNKQHHYYNNHNSNNQLQEVSSELAPQQDQR